MRLLISYPSHDASRTNTIGAVVDLSLQVAVCKSLEYMKRHREAFLLLGVGPLTSDSEEYSQRPYDRVA